MRLQRNIHPEIVFGTRKPKTFEVVTPFILKNLELVGGDIGTSIPEIADTLRNDPVATRFWTTVKNFEKGSSGVYYIPPKFSEALSLVEKNIPTDVLPVEFNGFFVFPEFRYKERGYVDGAYLRIFIDRDGRKSFCVSYIDRTGVISAISSPLRNTKPSDLVDDAMNIDEYMIDEGLRGSDKAKEIVKLVLNAAIYIFSQDPEIDSLKPQTKSTKCEKKFASQFGIQNMCSLEIKVLNWSFHGRVYSVDSTTVSAHFRWQPCGEGRQKVRLIWIDEHERKYGE